jgi:hypothetical protein
MSTVTIAVIAIIVVAAVLVIAAIAVRHRHRLQQRFGPEYDRLASEHNSKRKAESELSGRERRVRDLDIQPLTDSARSSYACRWAAIQEQFVDAPEDAVASSQLLVVAVMSELGYPAEDPNQMLADLSVEHATTLGHYRAAQETSQNAAAGTASTEDLRLAMINYRALFRDLVGETTKTGNGSSASEQAPLTDVGDVQFHGTPPEKATVEPVTEVSSQTVQYNEGNLTK